VSVGAFLAELRRRDIRVWAEGDRLHCDAPAGVLTDELRDELRRRKVDLLEFLRAAEALSHQQRAIVPLQHGGTGIPIFAVPGHNGDVFCFRALAQHLGEDRPFYGLEPPGLDGVGRLLERVEDMASYFADQIQAFLPGQPCIIAGYCAGATIGLELAKQLRHRDVPVPYLALFGAPYPLWYHWPAQWRWSVRREGLRAASHARELARRPFLHWPAYLREKWANRRERLTAEHAAANDPVLMRRRQVEQATLKAVRQYFPAPFTGRIGVFLPFHDPMLEDGARRWRRLARHADEHFATPGSDGFNLLLEPHAGVVAAQLRQTLAPLDSGGIHAEQRYAPDGAWTAEAGSPRLNGG
jgi:thioesterase domain-containing protein